MRITAAERGPQLAFLTRENHCKLISRPFLGRRESPSGEIWNILGPRQPWRLGAGYLAERSASRGRFGGSRPQSALTDRCKKCHEENSWDLSRHHSCLRRGLGRLPHWLDDSFS